MSETFKQTAARYQNLKDRLDRIPAPPREGSPVSAFNEALFDSTSKLESPELMAALDDIQLTIERPTRLIP